jgi:hypothetical protein
MADSKGGSDLDVFEGLTKKPAGRPSFPPPGPVPSRPGGAGLPPAGPPPLGPPPAQRERPRTMIGIAPPPAASGPLPPPSIPATRSTQSLPPGLPPPVSKPGGPPGPPPVSRGNLPPVVPPLSKPPSTSAGLPPLAPPPRSNVPAQQLAPPSPAAPKGGAGLADMDWDDEDEKTNIYDKEETAQQLQRVSKPLPAAGAPAKNLGGAAALLAGSGGAATSAPLPGPLPAPAPLPPPAMAPHGAVQAIPGPAPIPSRFESTQMLQKPTGGSKAPLFAFLGVLVLGVVAVGGYTMMNKKGTVIVAVKSGGRSVENTEIRINDRKVCDKTPCRVTDLEKGTIIVKASAPGYESGDQMVAVRGGEESPVTIELAHARDAVAATSAAVADPNGAPTAKAGTGFKVSGSTLLKLSVDGKELGALPQEVKDATPGEHKLKFYGSDRYKPEERSVTVVENEVKDLGTIKPKVLKGKATITLETTGARVTLVSGADRKSIPQFPISVDIDTSKQWVIQATKLGFEDFRLPIVFDDGEAEKTFAVSLNEKGKKKPDEKKPDTTDAHPTATATAKPDKPDVKVADTGNGTLNINSIPPSNCILDGRPLGSTPKAGVSVPAGTHTVIFVHSEKGRKQSTVTVKGGETKTVAVKF